MITLLLLIIGIALVSVVINITLTVCIFVITSRTGRIAKIESKIDVLLHRGPYAGEQMNTQAYGYYVPPQMK